MFPEFFIVGAAKAGTTSIRNHLNGHPGIHMGPIKEPNFFAFGAEGPNLSGPARPEVLRARLHVDTIVDESSYLALFAGARDGQVRGEASVRYLYKPHAARRIAQARPDARIVVILRDPIERLRSHYAMNRSLGLEPLGLAEALAAEDDRVAAGWGWDWHYVRVGLYAEQLKRYLDVFDREQIAVIGYEDLRSDPVKVVRAICAHIGADADYTPATTFRSKQAYVPRSRALDALRGERGPMRPIGRLLPTSIRRRAGAWLREVNHAPVDPIDDALRRRILERVGPDREALAELVGSRDPCGRTLG